VRKYSAYRKLTIPEKAHVYDALKLIILLGIIWSAETDFEKESDKIEFLNSMGRNGFLKSVFG
jgi:hypothetical protein